MSLSSTFIERPVATSLLLCAVALSGAAAFGFLPVSPLPQVDLPTISVGASLPGASPETMASSVATPLERQFSRIAGVTQMTSTSRLGSTGIVLQFDLSRNVDAAARDVQAAINAARGYLPTNLPGNPSYRKVNPADAPIFILSLTSDTLPKSRIYDSASTILAQKLSQVSGVGQVIVGGGASPSVRIELNPAALNKYGVGLEDVRATLNAANANLPKGHLSGLWSTWSIESNDQIFQAAAYAPLLVSYRNGAPIRISDVGTATDSVEDLRAAGYFNGMPSVVVIIFRQPGANIINTVDRIRAILPQMKAGMPPEIRMTASLDQTTTIRASVHEVEKTLVISTCLVILVVFFFLRNGRATFIPSVAVPLSLIGTFGVMYLCDFSLDNLSLMALTISTGFVVDDAIVVLENITRYLEKGMEPIEAALMGAREIGFTVVSISLSLVAVFIPLLLMGGIVGRLFREFAVTLAAAVLVSMAISLSGTPMMCARLLKRQTTHGRLYLASERFYQAVIRVYGRTLAWTLRFPAVPLLILAAAIVLNVHLFFQVPKGFFPQQDTGRMTGMLQGDQDTSFQAMDARLREVSAIVQRDPGVSGINSFTGGGNTANSARMFISLKPLEERNATADEIIARLRPRLARIPGATLYLQASQDLRVGGRSSSSQYEYTLRGDNLPDLDAFAPKLLAAMKKLPMLADVNLDQQNQGLEAYVQYDRATAARFGISPQLIDNTLYDAFGQRPVSTMYTAMNQYHVVMEVDPRFWQSPQSLDEIYIRSPRGREVPLSAIARYAPTTAPLTVNHHGLFPAVTISFNLTPGSSLGDAVEAVSAAASGLAMPATLHGDFAGTALAFQDSLKSQPLLIAAALFAVYIVLGILYESYLHPITILSTLPSAGVGALLALKLFHTDLSIIAMIGMILLIGIVKKNAIMMVDFALAAERDEDKTPYDAIHQACLLRFRPILMTTMSALLGALPLATGHAVGSELRRPLGLTIIGGLIVSQMLTLYTTPAVYLVLDRIRRRLSGHATASVSRRPGYMGGQS
ncbi:MAG: multidrug efflux RND transporter permease subunit [Bryobacterales bacterium]|nr:multidrug efflux RND transporter permease subunit [Bryobacterales bacterium]